MGGWAPDELRDECLAQPSSKEEFPFPRYPERSVFTVAGKVFAISPLDEQPLRVSLKCDPEWAVELRADHPDITPGYRLNKRHWNTVNVDGSVPDPLLRKMIAHSYSAVVAGLPRSKRPL